MALFASLQASSLTQHLRPLSLSAETVQMVLPGLALPLVGAALDRLVGGGGQRGGNAPQQQGAPQHPQPINIHIDLPFNIRNDNYNAVDLQAGLQAAQHAAQRAQAQAVAEAEAEADAIAAAEAEAKASAKNRNKVHNDVKVNQPDPAPVPQRGGRNPQPPKSRHGAGGSNSAPPERAADDPSDSELRKLKDQLAEYKEEVTRLSVQIQAILQAVGQDVGVLKECKSSLWLLSVLSLQVNFPRCGPDWLHSTVCRQTTSRRLPVVPGAAGVTNDVCAIISNHRHPLRRWRQSGVLQRSRLAWPHSLRCSTQCGIQAVCGARSEGWNCGRKAYS